MLLKPFNRATALATAFAFLTTNLYLPGAFALESEVPIDSRGGFPVFQIPADLGTLETLHLSHSPDAPFLIHLQTAHGDYAVQKKIQALLHYLTTHYGINQILVEGAGVPLDPGLDRVFSKADWNRELNELRAKNGLATGAGLFLLEALEKGRPAEAQGIESVAAYRKNRLAFRSFLRERERLAPLIEDYDRKMEERFSKVFSRPLRNFLLRENAFEEKTLGLTDWLGELRREARARLGISFNHPYFQKDWPSLYRLARLTSLAEARPDAGAFDKEKKKFLSEAKRFLAPLLFQEVKSYLARPSARPYGHVRFLFEKVSADLPPSLTFDHYPRLRIWLVQRVLQNEIRSDLLFEELERLTRLVAGRLAKGRRERRALRLFWNYRLARRLLAAELTPEDYSVIASPAFGGLAMTSVFQKALAFYHGARAREGHMVRNIGRSLVTLRHSESRLMLNGSSRGEPVKAVLVTGGFHVPGLQEAFLKRDYSYALVTPKIEEVGEGRKNYFNTFLSRLPDSFSFSQIEDGALLPIPRSELRAHGISPDFVDGLRQAALSEFFRLHPAARAETRAVIFSRRLGRGVVVDGDVMVRVLEIKMESARLNVQGPDDLEVPPSARSAEKGWDLELGIGENAGFRKGGNPFRIFVSEILGEKRRPNIQRLKGGEFQVRIGIAADPAIPVHSEEHFQTVGPRFRELHHLLLSLKGLKRGEVVREEDPEKYKQARYRFGDVQIMLEDDFRRLRVRGFKVEGSADEDLLIDKTNWYFDKIRAALVSKIAAPSDVAPYRGKRAEVRLDIRPETLTWAGDLQPTYPTPYSQTPNFYDRHVLVQFAIAADLKDLSPQELIEKLNLEAGVHYWVSDRLFDSNYHHSGPLQRLRVVGKDEKGNYLVAGIFEVPEERISDLELIRQDPRKNMEGIDFYVDLHYGPDRVFHKKTAPDFTHVHFKYLQSSKEIISPDDKLDLLELLHLLDRHRIISSSLFLGDYSFWSPGTASKVVSNLNREELEKILRSLNREEASVRISDAGEWARARGLFQALEERQEVYHKANIAADLQSGDEERLKKVGWQFLNSAVKSGLDWRDFFPILERFISLAEDGLLTRKQVEHLKSLQSEDSHYPPFMLEAPFWTLDLDRALAQKGLDGLEEFLGTFELPQWQSKEFPFAFDRFLRWYLFRHHGLKIPKRKDGPVVDPWPASFPSKKDVIQRYQSYLGTFIPKMARKVARESGLAGELRWEHQKALAHRFGEDYYRFKWPLSSHPRLPEDFHEMVEAWNRWRQADTPIRDLIDERRNLETSIVLKFQSVAGSSKQNEILKVTLPSDRTIRFVYQSRGMNDGTYKFTQMDFIYRDSKKPRLVIRQKVGGEEARARRFTVLRLPPRRPFLNSIRFEDGAFHFDLDVDAWEHDLENFLNPRYGSRLLLRPRPHFSDADFTDGRSEVRSPSLLRSFGETASTKPRKGRSRAEVRAGPQGGAFGVQTLTETVPTSITVKGGEEIQGPFTFKFLLKWLLLKNHIPYSPKDNPFDLVVAAQYTTPDGKKTIILTAKDHANKNLPAGGTLSVTVKDFSAAKPVTLQAPADSAEKNAGPRNLLPQVVTVEKDSGKSIMVDPPVSLKENPVMVIRYQAGVEASTFIQIFNGDNEPLIAEAEERTSLLSFFWSPASIFQKKRGSREPVRLNFSVPTGKTGEITIHLEEKLRRGVKNFDVARIHFVGFSGKITLRSITFRPRSEVRTEEFFKSLDAAPGAEHIVPETSEHKPPWHGKPQRFTISGSFHPGLRLVGQDGGYSATALDGKPEEGILKIEVRTAQGELAGYLIGNLTKGPRWELVQTHMGTHPDWRHWGLMHDVHPLMKMRWAELAHWERDIREPYTLKTLATALHQYLQTHDIEGGEIAKKMKAEFERVYEWVGKATSGGGELVPYLSTQLYKVLAGLLAHDEALRQNLRQIYPSDFLSGRTRMGRLTAAAGFDGEFTVEVGGTPENPTLTLVAEKSDTVLLAAKPGETKSLRGPPDLVLFVLDLSPLAFAGMMAFLVMAFLQGHPLWWKAVLSTGVALDLFVVVGIIVWNVMTSGPSGDEKETHPRSEARNDLAREEWSVPVPRWRWFRRALIGPRALRRLQVPALAGGVSPEIVTRLVERTIDEAPLHVRGKAEYPWHETTGIGGTWSRLWFELGEASRGRPEEADYLALSLLYLFPDLAPGSPFQKVAQELFQRYPAVREAHYQTAGGEPTAMVRRIERPFHSGKLPGYLILPRKSLEAKAVPAIVLIPGFTSIKEEPYPNLLEGMLVEAGYAVARYDLPGHGEQLGQPFSPELQFVRDYLDAISQDFEFEYEGGKRLRIIPQGIFGYSLGGRLAAGGLADEKIAGRIRAVVTLSTPFEYAFRHPESWLPRYGRYLKTFFGTDGPALFASGIGRFALDRDSFPSNRRDQILVLMGGRDGEVMPDYPWLSGILGDHLLLFKDEGHFFLKARENAARAAFKFINERIPLPPDISPAVSLVHAARSESRLSGMAPLSGTGLGEQAKSEARATAYTVTEDGWHTIDFHLRTKGNFVLFDAGIHQFRFSGHGFIKWITSGQSDFIIQEKTGESWVLFKQEDDPVYYHLIRQFAFYAYAFLLKSKKMNKGELPPPDSEPSSIIVQYASNPKSEWVMTNGALDPIYIVNTRTKQIGTVPSSKFKAALEEGRTPEVSWKDFGEALESDQKMIRNLVYFPIVFGPSLNHQAMKMRFDGFFQEDLSKAIQSAISHARVEVRAVPAGELSPQEKFEQAMALIHANFQRLLSSSPKEGRDLEKVHDYLAQMTIVPIEGLETRHFKMGRLELGTGGHSPNYLARLLILSAVTLMNPEWDEIQKRQEYNRLFSKTDLLTAADRQKLLNEAVQEALNLEGEEGAEVREALGADEPSARKGAAPSQQMADRDLFVKIRLYLKTHRDATLADSWEVFVAELDEALGNTDRRISLLERVFNIFGMILSSQRHEQTRKELRTFSVNVATETAETVARAVIEYLRDPYLGQKGDNASQPNWADAARQIDLNHILSYLKEGAVPMVMEKNIRRPLVTAEISADIEGRRTAARGGTESPLGLTHTMQKTARALSLDAPRTGQLLLTGPTESVTAPSPQGQAGDYVPALDPRHGYALGASVLIDQFLKVLERASHQKDSQEFVTQNIPAPFVKNLRIGLDRQNERAESGLDELSELLVHLLYMGGNQKLLVRWVPFLEKTGLNELARTLKEVPKEIAVALFVWQVLHGFLHTGEVPEGARVALLNRLTDLGKSRNRLFTFVAEYLEQVERAVTSGQDLKSRARQEFQAGVLARKEERQGKKRESTRRELEDAGIPIAGLAAGPAAKGEAGWATEPTLEGFWFRLGRLKLDEAKVLMLNKNQANAQKTLEELVGGASGNLKKGWHAVIGAIHPDMKTHPFRHSLGEPLAREIYDFFLPLNKFPGGSWWAEDTIGNALLSIQRKLPDLEKAKLEAEASKKRILEQRLGALETQVAQMSAVVGAMAQVVTEMAQKTGTQVPVALLEYKPKPAAEGPDHGRSEARASSREEEVRELIQQVLDRLPEKPAIRPEDETRWSEESYWLHWEDLLKDLGLLGEQASAGNWLEIREAFRGRFQTDELISRFQVFRTWLPPTIFNPTKEDLGKIPGKINSILLKAGIATALAGLPAAPYDQNARLTLSQGQVSLAREPGQEDDGAVHLPAVVTGRLQKIKMELAIEIPARSASADSDFLAELILWALVVGPNEDELAQNESGYGISVGPKTKAGIRIVTIALPARAEVRTGDYTSTQYGGLDYGGVMISPVFKILILDKPQKEDQILALQEQYPGQVRVDKRIGLTPEKLKEVLKEEDWDVIFIRSDTQSFKQEEFLNLFYQGRSGGKRVRPAFLFRGGSDIGIDPKKAKAANVHLIRSNGNEESVRDLFLLFLRAYFRLIHPEAFKDVLSDPSQGFDWSSLIATGPEEYRAAAVASKRGTTLPEQMEILFALLGLTPKEATQEFFQKMTIGFVGIGVIPAAIADQLNASHEILGGKIPLLATSRTLVDPSQAGDEARKKAERDHGVKAVDKQTILKEANVISVHTPEQSGEVLSAADLEILADRKGPLVLINTSRPIAVNLAGLRAALQKKSDLYFFADNALIKTQPDGTKVSHEELEALRRDFPGQVFLTSHIAASTEAAGKGVQEKTVDGLRALIRVAGGEMTFDDAPLNFVTRPEMSVSPAQTNAEARAETRLDPLGLGEVIEISEDKIRSRGQDHLSGVDTTKRKIVAIYGGLGSLIERFVGVEILKLKDLFPNVRFVIVDKRNYNRFPDTPEGNEAYRNLVVNKMKSLKLPWLNAIESDGDYLKNLFERDSFDKALVEGQGKVALNGIPPFEVDGAYEALPFDHFEIAKLYASLGKHVVAEKPLAEMEKIPAFWELYNRHPDLILAADFLVQADTMDVALEHSEEVLGVDIIRGLGNLKRVRGRLVEAWSIEDERDPTAANLDIRSWLRDPRVGGMLLDQGSHVFAMIARPLYKFGHVLRDATLTEAYRFIYDDQGKSPEPVDLETYAYGRLELNGIQIAGDFGKGLDETFYGVVLEGDGEIQQVQIATGTEERVPFIRIVYRDGRIQTFILRSASLGYHAEILDFYLAMYGHPDRFAGDPLKARFSFAADSIEIARRIKEKAAAVEKHPVYELPATGVDPIVIPAGIPPTGNRSYFASDKRRAEWLGRALEELQAQVFHSEESMPWIEKVLRKAAAALALSRPSGAQEIQGQDLVYFAALPHPVDAPGQNFPPLLRFLRTDDGLAIFQSPFRENTEIRILSQELEALVAQGSAWRIAAPKDWKAAPMTMPSVERKLARATTLVTIQLDELNEARVSGLLKQIIEVNKASGWKNFGGLNQDLRWNIKQGYASGTVFAAFDDEGRLVGYAWVVTNPRGGHAEFYLLAVRKDWKEPALGRRLAGAALDYLEEHSVSVVGASIDVGNKDAIRLLGHVMRKRGLSFESLESHARNIIKADEGETLEQFVERIRRKGGALQIEVGAGVSVRSEARSSSLLSSFGETTAAKPKRRSRAEARAVVFFRKQNQKVRVDGDIAKVARESSPSFSAAPPTRPRAEARVDAKRFSIRRSEARVSMTGMGIEAGLTPAEFTSLLKAATKGFQKLAPEEKEAVTKILKHRKLLSDSKPTEKGQRLLRKIRDYVQSKNEAEKDELRRQFEEAYKKMHPDSSSAALETVDLLDDSPLSETGKPALEAVKNEKGKTLAFVLKNDAVTGPPKGVKIQYVVVERASSPRDIVKAHGLLEQYQIESFEIRGEKKGKLFITERLEPSERVTVTLVPVKPRSEVRVAASFPRTGLRSAVPERRPAGYRTSLGNIVRSAAVQMQNVFLPEDVIDLGTTTFTRLVGAPDAWAAPDFGAFGQIQREVEIKLAGAPPVLGQSLQWLNTSEGLLVSQGAFRTYAPVLAALAHSRSELRIAIVGEGNAQEREALSRIAHQLNPRFIVSESAVAGFLALQRQASSVRGIGLDPVTAARLRQLRLGFENRPESDLGAYAAGSGLESLLERFQAAFDRALESAA